MKIKILLLSLLNFLFLNFLEAQTWNGNTSTSWNTASNWSTNAVPVATGNVTIPAGLARYPVLASNVTINSIDMKAGSQLDFKGFKLTINTTNNFNYFIGATLDNTTAGSDIVIDINTGTGGYVVYFRSSTVNDNITFNLSGTNAFNEADIGTSANTFSGNVTFNISGTMGFSLSNGDASQFNGNLVVNRTAGGNSQLFNGGGGITGNFGFTNTIDGSTLLGNDTKRTAIGGTVNISINQATPAAFQLFHLINQTAGGNINVQNTQGFNVQKDTLKVTALSITGYRGNDFGYFYNNQITGNITLANDASYAGGYVTYIRSNNITGNATFTNSGSNTLNEGDIGSSGNHFTGNVSITCGGTGSLYISHGDASRYDGNLTINRTATGHTQAFNSGGIVGGNFSFTNNTAGNSLFGVLTTKTSVGGMVNIALNNTTPGSFQLFYVINQTTGGNINVQNTQGFNVQKDTLKVTALSITGYRGNDFGYFYDNDITGNLTLANDASYGGGYVTYIRSNKITGNAIFTNSGTNTMNDADIGGSGNTYSGNVSYTKTGGPINVGGGDITQVGGNLTLNSSSGITLNKIRFTVGLNGVLEQTGTQSVNIASLTMGKTGTGTLTLNDTVTVTNNLNLNSGIILAGTNSNLILPDDVSYTGGSDASYIDGPMIKTGNESFIFPLGQNNSYAPISITAPSNVADQFRAKYIYEVPHDAGYDSTQLDPTLNHISRKEYWLLDRITGTSNVKVTLSWDQKRSGVVNDLPSLRVARWNGSTWKDAGNGGTTGNNTQGTVQSLNAVTSFSPFTLASINALNALPVTFLNFSVDKCNNNVCLQWSTENEKNFSHFEIEKAKDDYNFITVGRINATNNAALQQYSFSDNAPNNGIIFYRLKLVDVDGSFKYSKVQSVKFSLIESFVLYPNPAKNQIRILSSKKIISVEITDVSGKLIKRMAANTDNRYDINELQKGLYIIKISGENYSSISKKLVID